jgi:hypothetical protein
MSFEVTIIRNSDGARAIHVEEKYHWNDGSDFIWNEGNCSCDCNRAILFALARGEKIPLNGEVQCGNKLFSVELPPITWNS